jgi:hypothetical protein
MNNLSITQGREYVKMDGYETVPLFDMGNIWRYVPDGYPPAARMYRRHYSCYQYKDNRRDDPNYANRNLILGPGEKMLLMTPKDNALFGWRKFIDDSGQTGVNCAIFRNESEHLASWLIEQAVQLAWQRWPGERLYTSVNQHAVKSANPGYCYKKAGWSSCGKTKSKGLLIFELLSGGTPL